MTPDGLNLKTVKLSTISMFHRNAMISDRGKGYNVLSSRLNFTDTGTDIFHFIPSSFPFHVSHIYNIIELIFE